MSPSEGLAAAVAQIEAAAAAGKLTDADLQRLIALAVAAYGARRRAGDEDGGPEPFPDPAKVTRGDVATLACAMLDAVDMDVFELQMWKSLGPA